MAQRLAALAQCLMRATPRNPLVASPQLDETVHSFGIAAVGSVRRPELHAWCQRWAHVLDHGRDGSVNAGFAGEDYWQGFFTSQMSRSGSPAYEWGGNDSVLSMMRLAARLKKAATTSASLPSGGDGGAPRVLHAGCGTSRLGAALARHGWDVVNQDFCRDAVEFLQEMDELGLLCGSSDELYSGRRAGSSTYVVGDSLRPPLSWQASFDVVVEKGLLDTLLFGSEVDSLARAVSFGEAVGKLLRPGGVLLQLSDAPLAMRRELLAAVWSSDRAVGVAQADEMHQTACGWSFSSYATVAHDDMAASSTEQRALMSLLIAQKPSIGEKL